MEVESFPLNSLRWTNTVVSAKKLCITTSLKILWCAWNVDKKYTTVEQWCHKAYHWKKEDMINEVGPFVYSEMNVSHPDNLSDDAALQVLTKLMTNFSPLAIAILDRVIHAPLSTSYYDICVTDTLLTKMICELTFLVKSFLRIIQGVAGKIMKLSVKEYSSRLKNARKSFKQTNKLSFHHKPILDETRKDLELTQCKMRERLNSRGRQESGASFDNKSRNKSSTKTENAIELTNFCNNSSASVEDVTSDEIEPSNEFVNDTQNLLQIDLDGHFGISNPVPIIDVHLKETNSDDSIDEEIRVRLDSNAYAEKTKIDIQGKVIVSQLHVSKLREDMKLFHKNFSVCKSFISSIITQTLETIRQNANSSIEFDVNNAKNVLSLIDQSALSKSIQRVRQATKSCILKHHMVLDMKKWLNEFTFDRHLVNSISPLRIIEKVTSARSSFKQVLGRTEKTKFLLVEGPVGSGKTYLTKYLLNNWNRKGHNLECPFDYDALIPISSSFFSSNQSLEEHLLEMLNINSSTELLHPIQLNDFNQMRVLFIAEIDLSSKIEKIKEYISDISHLHEGIKTIITCRNEFSKSIETLIHMQNTSIEIFQILCLDEVLLKKFVQNYLEDGTSAQEFCSLYESLNLESNLRHPLFILMSIYLWTKNHSFLISATCLSKLIMSLMVEFHIRASDYHNQRYHVHVENSHCWADRCVKSLCESVWPETTAFAVKEEIDGLTEIIPPTFDLEELFHPFIIFLDGRCYLAHSALKELLSGVYLAGKICKKRRSLCFPCCGKINFDELTIDNRMLSTECLIVAAGIWSLTQNLQQSIANKLASWYAPSAAGSPLQWLQFISETGQCRKICMAVAAQLKWKSVWNAGNYSLEENVAASELLRIEAYHPRKVIIEEECSGVVELLNSLALCPTVQVVLRLERHFFTWDDPDVSDSLVELLQPAGNLVDLWGHLDSTGALALRHMKKLVDLNVRISSVEALITFAATLPWIPTLQSLSLRLNISFDIRTNIVPSFSDFKGDFWLRLDNITDEKRNWAVEVINNLQRKPLEVHLSHSVLSPDVLQDMKLSVGTGNIYVS